MSKLKAVDPKKAEPSHPKVLIYGKPGVGKTWTSLDFPSVYFIDTEGGANLPHYTDKLKKSGGVYFGPDQGSTSFKSIIDEIKALATEEHSYKTLVIDSISKVFNMEIANEAERLTREKKKNEFGLDKKAAVGFIRQLVNWLMRLDMNVILIAHEKAEWKNGEQVGDTFDCWDKLEYELDLCLQIFKQGPEHNARVRKTRLLGFPAAEVFPWSYDEFSKRYGKDIMEKAAKPIQLATPEQLKKLQDLLERVKLPEGLEEKWLAGSTWAELSGDRIEGAIKYINDTYLTTKETK